MASDKNVAKIVKLQEKIKVELKNLIKEAMQSGMTREDVDKTAKEMIQKFLKDNKDVKLEYNKLYKMWEMLLYNNFITMYKISFKTLDRELNKDKISHEVSQTLKEVYKSDKVKKESYVFKSNDQIDDKNINASDTPNSKFIRTSGEYGYTQMQIDNYVEKVEKTMDKIAQLNFVAVNSQGARISLRNKAEMEVRYQDMLSDLKELKNEQFVVVSQHRDSSLRCACWQGLIYLKDTDGTDVSLLNWHEWNNVNNHITPKPIGYTENNQPYYSLKEKIEHGLFSYNCRHRFIKYEQGAKVPKQYPYNPNKESASSLIDKEMRQMEQNIRRAKERQTLALTPKERKKWQAKSKKLQAQYDEFCKKHNRVRNDWRTSIGDVERGAIKSINQRPQDTNISVENITEEKETIKSSNQDNNNVAKENEFDEIPSYVEVSVDYKSKEYQNKLKQLNFSNRQTKQVYKGIKRIFNNKASREKEGFYMVDLNNLSHSFYSGDGKPQQVNRTDKIKQYIKNNPNANIVTIHNHRGDNLPSVADIGSNRFSNSHQAIVIGNKGSIYYLNVDYKQLDLEANLVELLQNEDYNKIKGNDKLIMFEKFCQENHITFKILRKEEEQNE